MRNRTRRPTQHELEREANLQRPVLIVAWVSAVAFAVKLVYSQDPGRRWMAFFLFALAGLLLVKSVRNFLKDRKIRQRKAAGLCRRCGYDIRESPDRCPECGAFQY